MSLQEADRTLPRDDLAAMVAFARPGWRLLEATLMENGQGSVYHLVVDTDAGRRTCVLKTSPGGDEQFDVGTEARVQAVVAEHTALAVPGVLAVVDDHEELRTPYYLMEVLPGDHLPEVDEGTLPAERRGRLAREMGRALGRLHDLNVDLATYGGSVEYEDATTRRGEPPPGDPGRLVVDDGHETWPAALREMCEGTLERLADSRFADLAPRFRAELARRFRALPEPSSPVPGLWDLHRENLLVDRQTGAITGLLDWESAAAMPRGYSLAIQEWYFVGISGVDLPEPHCDPLLKWVLDREELWAGYREVSTAPGTLGTRHPCYQLVFLMKDMAFIDGWTTDAWSVQPSVPLPDERAEELAAAYRVAAEAHLDGAPP